MVNVSAEIFISYRLGDTEKAFTEDSVDAAEAEVQAGGRRMVFCRYEEQTDTGPGLQSVESGDVLAFVLAQFDSLGSSGNTSQGLLCQPSGLGTTNLNPLELQSVAQSRLWSNSVLLNENFNLGADTSAGISFGVHRDHQYQQAVRRKEELQPSRKIFNVKVITSNTKKVMLEAVGKLEKLAVGEMEMFELLAVGEVEMSEILVQTEMETLLRQRKTNAAKQKVAKLPSCFQTTKKTVSQLMQKLGESLPSGN